MASTPTAPRRSDPRRLVYAVVDVLLAGVYLVALQILVTPRDLTPEALLWGLVVVAAVMAGGMFWPSRWGWLLAACATGALLLLAVVLLTLIIASAAFLSGVFGAFGRGAASVALVVAAVVIELVALVPALQLKFLMTRAGRRSFGLPPLGKSRAPGPPAPAGEPAEPAREPA